MIYIINNKLNLLYHLLLFIIYYIECTFIILMKKDDSNINNIEEGNTI